MYQTTHKMKTYKSELPEITLKLKKGTTLNRQIKFSEDVVEVFREIWDNDSMLICETMMCIFLNRASKTIGWFKVSQGGISSTIIDNRLILVTALTCLASRIIIAHNHPSGNLQVSDGDVNVTKKLNEAAKLLDIELLDHIILTETEHYSMKDNGIF